MLKQKTQASRYDILVAHNLESYENVRFEGSIVESSALAIFEILEQVKERLQRAGKSKVSQMQPKVKKAAEFLPVF